jgi:hypothetical protein
MSQIVLLSMGFGMGSETSLADEPATAGRVRELDLYGLSADQLAAAPGLLIGMHSDQIFLAGNESLLAAYVRAGGRVMVSGQVARSFLPGLSTFTPMRYSGVEDLTVRRADEHPVWYGVADEDLTFRRGVAGFYGRGSFQPPSGATVINVLGPQRLALDYHYLLGAGEVLVHGGNDIWSYRHAENTSARMTPQLLDWLVAR